MIFWLGAGECAAEWEDKYGWGSQGTSKGRTTKRDP